jgi:hypothetical protein
MIVMVFVEIESKGPKTRKEGRSKSLGKASKKKLIVEQCTGVKLTT